MSTALEKHVIANKGGMEDVANGVTVFWLAKHFGLQVSTVRQKLAGCPAVAKKSSGWLYLIKDAAPYLVKPKMDPEALIKSMRSQDLPPTLQAQFWQANLARQKWEKAAGELWDTGSVLECFGEVFKILKVSTQLWPDTVEKMAGLTDEQREVLQNQIDVMLTEIRDRISEMSRERSTPSSVARLDDLLTESVTKPVENEPDDDGIDALI